MEHTVTNKDIIINLSIQLIQIFLFFWVFVHFFGKKIAERVVQRQIREKKLAQADVEYQKIIDDAKSNADQIIKDATQTKNNLTTQ
jgi:F0F1-type ATP synthase membrane subunit b/b'